MSPRVTITVLFNIVSFMWISVIVCWHRIRLQNRLKALEMRKMRLVLDAQ
jgi:hypothetical protein